MNLSQIITIFLVIVPGLLLPAAHGNSLKGLKRPNYNLIHSESVQNVSKTRTSGLEDKVAIVGGMAAKHPIPYQVSLQRSDSGAHFCGGAILTGNVLSGQPPALVKFHIIQFFLYHQINGY